MTEPQKRLKEAAPEDLRAALATLAQADTAVRQFPEPRIGPEFEAANRAWQRAYAAVLRAGGTEIHNDRP